MLAWLFLPFVLTVQAAALHTHLRGDTIGAWGAAYVVGGLVVAVLFWRTGIRRTSRPLGWATLVALLGSVVLIQRDEVWAYAGVAVCLLSAGAFWLSPRGARLTGTRTDEATIGGRGATPSGGAPGTGDDARPEGTGPPDADAERLPAVARDARLPVRDPSRRRPPAEPISIQLEPATTRRKLTLAGAGLVVLGGYLAFLGVTGEDLPTLERAGLGVAAAFLVLLGSAAGRFAWVSRAGSRLVIDARGIRVQGRRRWDVPWSALDAVAIRHLDLTGPDVPARAGRRRRRSWLLFAPAAENPGTVTLRPAPASLRPFVLQEPFADSRVQPDEQAVLDTVHEALTQVVPDLYVGVLVD